MLIFSASSRSLPRSSKPFLRRIGMPQSESACMSVARGYMDRLIFITPTSTAHGILATVIGAVADRSVRPIPFYHLPIPTHYCLEDTSHIPYSTHLQD